jgi:trimeric autotransporter adhesin
LGSNIDINSGDSIHVLEKKKMKRNLAILCLITIITIFASSVLAGTPHTIWGNVNNAGDGTLADGSTVTVYVEGRSEEILTDIVGVSGNSGTANAWSIDTGNFETAWASDDTLIISVDDGNGYTSETSIVLTDAGSQQAPDMTLTPIPVYSVDLSPNTQTNSGNPASDVAHTITITNTGNTADTYTITKNTGTLSTSSISLNSGASTTFTLTYSIPSNAIADQSYDASVTATSTNDNSKTETVTVTTTANAVYNIEVTPNSQTKDINPGTSTAHSITITNTGNTADTYSVSTNGGTLSTSSVSLARGASQSISLTVSAPPATSAGTTYNYEVTATSDNDETKTETVSTTTTVNAAYGVGLTPDTQEANADPSDNAVYTFTIQNTGNTADTFTISSTSGTLSKTSATLSVGSSTTFTLTYTVPEGALADQEFDVDVTATSDNDGSKTDTVSVITTANQIYGVDVSPNSQSGDVDPGSDKIYTITIINTGNGVDTYSLTTTEGTLSDSSVVVAYGGTRDVSLTVTAPAGTLAGTTYNYDVTATSDNDETKTETVSTITTVNAAYNVDLSPNTQTGNADPGESSDYTLTITNTGNIADTYTLSSTDGTFNTNSVELDVGDSTDVIFTTDIPASAMAGDTFTDYATVTSDSDETKTDTISTTTTANAVYGVDLSPNTQDANADPSAEYVYEITINNLGNAEDTYTISSTDGTLNQTTATLSAGSSTIFTLSYSVPENALADQEFDVDVTATSDNDETKTKTVTATTTANAFANGVLNTFTSSESIKLGDSSDFTIDFQNTGNYDFEATAYVNVKDSSNTLVGTLTGTATSVAVGVTETLTINLGDLITSTGYYTLEPRVEYENKTATGTSNSLQVLSLPNLSIDPNSLSLTMATDKLTTSTLYLSNEGESILTIDPETPWESSNPTLVSITSIPETIGAKSTVQTTIQIDTTGLDEEINEATLTINSDAGSQTISFTITVNNSNPAVLVSNPIKIIESTDSTKEGSVTLNNLGGTDASNISASILGDLSSVFTLGSIPTNILIGTSSSISYSIDVTNLSIGEYSDTLRITYDSTGSQTLDIPITLTVEGSELTISSASVSGLAGTVQTTTATIENSGTVDITNIVLTANDLGSFSADNIAVSPSTIAGLNPGESVTLSIEVTIPSGTSVATYTGNISIISNELNDNLSLSVTVETNNNNNNNNNNGNTGGTTSGTSSRRSNDDDRISTSNKQAILEESNQNQGRKYNFQGSLWEIMF